MVRSHLDTHLSPAGARGEKALGSPPVPPLDDIFSGHVFAQNSFGDILTRRGGFNFIADLHRQMLEFNAGLEI